MLSLVGLVLALVSGAMEMDAFGPTPIMVGAMSYNCDKVIVSLCNSAKEVC